MSKFANENFNEQLLDSSFLAEKNIRVLKHDETFGIFDRYGDIVKRDNGEQGLYNAGTRYLSRCELHLCGRKPLLLSSFISEDNAALMVDMTNPSLNHGVIPSGAVHIQRSVYLRRETRCDQLTFKSYLDEFLELSIDLLVEADYFDIFEVRGHTREQRGEYLPPEIEPDRLTLHYLGLDKIHRYTCICPTMIPSIIAKNHLRFLVGIPPKGSTVLEINFSLGTSDSHQSEPSKNFVDGYIALKEEISHRRASDAFVVSSNEQFNDLINRSIADTHLLVTATSSGPYPYAGVPWFSAPFGRDGIITALELLWINPSFSKAVLYFLAETQGTEIDPANDCEPGKIIHESRKGEMANLGEIPFRKYYGSVDSTPLFVVLAGAYYQRTGDLGFIKSIWHNIKSALQWMEEYGDSDRDGFIEYHRQTDAGLVHQGWKDSDNSVFHRDGSLAQAPIALCEVQGYLYLARKRAARLAEAMGDFALAEKMRVDNLEFRKKFHDHFWVDDIGYYALALDKDKTPCGVKSSNVGHCLYCGLIVGEYADRVAGVLMSEEMFSGWGIRTIGENETLYNPMSYHNGTIWPHDCAIIGAGLARYGYKDYALQVMSALFDASNLVDFHRLPELFCGFRRAPGRNPTIYPMSCAPQAWAAGSIFMLLGACLGIKIKAESNELVLYHPRMPSYLDSVTIRNLQVAGGSMVDINFTNHGHDVSVDILKRLGDSRIIVVK